MQRSRGRDIKETRQLFNFSSFQKVTFQLFKLLKLNFLLTFQASRKSSEALNWSRATGLACH
jgi:hypothetical protein